MGPADSIAKRPQTRYPNIKVGDGICIRPGCTGYAQEDALSEAENENMSKLALSNNRAMAGWKKGSISRIDCGQAVVRFLENGELRAWRTHLDNFNENAIFNEFDEYAI